MMTVTKIVVKFAMPFRCYLLQFCILLLCTVMHAFSFARDFDRSHTFEDHVIMQFMGMFQAFKHRPGGL